MVDLSNIITTEDCVSAAMRDLGYETCTYGPFKHEKLGFIASLAFKYAEYFIKNK